MGNTRWGLGILFIFMSIFLVMMMHKCVNGRNLTTPSCSEQERLALVKFKHSVKDDYGMLSSWEVANDCCRWERVGCDDATGKVVSLHLRKNVKEDYDFVDRDIEVLVEDYGLVSVHENLVGNELSSCLAELVNLKHLDLSGNDFQQSRIPKFIGSLKQLSYLNLSDAGFSANIPRQIGNLSDLMVLDLSSYYTTNLMTNDITWVSGLSKLEHLDLSRVDLSRAQNLDILLYMIPSLLKLRLSGCGVSMAHFGPRHLNSSTELAGITHLDLSENGFKGQLRGLFLNMTSLVFLDLSKNHLNLSWSLANLLNMMPSLLELRLSGCELQKVNLSPTNLSFGTFSNIQYLDLSQNDIEGTFPYILSNLSSLLSLDLSQNILNSLIPIMPNLFKLDISYNNFRQIEDVGIWRQCYLKELIVSSNYLEGEIISPSTNVSKCSQIALEILYLDRNRLNCSIPGSIGRFTHLRALDLSVNELSGPIPEALSRLRSLQGLYLHFNQLSSSVPEFLGSLTALREIVLGSNQLTGPIPVSLGTLTSLRVFSVFSNFLNGTIPNSVGNLIKLYLLDISNNYFVGVVSEDHFANFSMLKYLDANSNNKLLFNISREWTPPFQLKVARLGSCKIEDGFPRWFRTQRKLKELVLSNASLFGPLPTWLRHMHFIRILDLSQNKLTGPLTKFPFTNFPLRYYDGYKLSMILLQNNLFKGLIPRWLCTRTDLQVLNLSRNRLTGIIPKCLWNLNLDVMLLSSNRLSGVIPSSLDLSSLKWLQLNDNNFNGELPRDFFWYFKILVVLDLGENKFSGNIPNCFGENIILLGALRLHNNNFTGHIPHSLCKFQLLQILDLAHNNLTGFIPRCLRELEGMKEKLFDFDIISRFEIDFGLGNIMQVLKGNELYYTKTLKFVINMDLSSNKLVGEIPETLTTLDALVGLNLSFNHFSRGIPNNIGNMKSLNSLDLSGNELTGMIPPSIRALNFLSYLNLSQNNLSGQIPSGNQLQTLTDPSIYDGNMYLCGAPLPKECYPHEKPPTTTSKNRDKIANEPNKVWFDLDIMSGFVTGFGVIIGVLSFKKEWNRKLFMFFEIYMDKIYNEVRVTVLKMKSRS